MECAGWALSSVLISDFLCGERDCLFLEEFSSNGAWAQGGEILCRMETDEQQAGFFITCFILLHLALHVVLEMHVLEVVSVSNNFGTTCIATVFLIWSRIRT